MMERQTSRRAARAVRCRAWAPTPLWLAFILCAAAPGALAANTARADADAPESTAPALFACEPHGVRHDGPAASAPELAKPTDEAARDEDEDNDNADATQGTGGGDEFHRWGFSLHAGASIPHPDFSDTRRPGPDFGVDLEYRFNKYFSLEGIYTFHRFGGERLGPFGPGQVFIELDDLNLHQFSLNGKVYAAGGNAPVRPFFNFGGGAYKFDPGDTRGGVNVGGGLQFDVTTTLAVEGAYNFHNVFGVFNDARFSTVQAGVRFRF